MEDPHISLKKLTTAHVAVARTLDSLGFVRRLLNDLKQAKDCDERALVARLKQLEPEHVDAATSFHKLGFVRCQVDDLKHTKNFNVHTLDIRLPTSIELNRRISLD